MNVVSPSSPAAAEALRGLPPGPKPPATESRNEAELRNAFNAFVGEAFFGQMLQAMRKTVGKPAYFHGGRAEEIFQQQLDQVLGEKLSQSSGSQFSQSMYELFNLERR